MFNHKFFYHFQTKCIQIYKKKKKNPTLGTCFRPETHKKLHFHLKKAILDQFETIQSLATARVLSFNAPAPSQQ